MELLFLILLIVIMAISLGVGFPVAFALPGSAIITIGTAAFFGYLFENDFGAFFYLGGPSEWLSAGVTNLRGVYWEVERDTLIAIPLFIFMGLMLQRSRIAEDLLVTMAQLFGPVRGGLGISVVFVGALLAATTGIVGATVVAMGLISLPAMLRNKYSAPLATGTIAASGTLGQIIPPSIVLIILADQLASASDQASTMRKALYKEATGQISMPSIFDVTSTSAGEMFLGAFLPGILLVGIYMLFILVLAFIFPKTAPAVPYDGKMDKKFWLNVMLILIPPLTLIILVLGSIITGIATVNQAGAIGAAGAIIMAGYRQTEGFKSSLYPAILVIISVLILAYAVSNYNMNVKLINTVDDQIGIFLGTLGSVILLFALAWSCWRLFKFGNTMQGVMLETAKTTSLVFIILLGAAMLTAAFRAFGGEELVKEYLNSLPGGFWTKFVIVMLVIFILGFFLDFIEIAVVVVPIVAPILLSDPSANITAVWLGVMIGLNIQTSFLTPPFGFALFYLRGVASKAVKTIEMYKGVIPFITLQLIALAVVGSYPYLVNYLPNRLSFTSETSPPPKNPKLQLCIENFMKENVLSDKNATKNSIDLLANADLTTLPKEYKKIIVNSIANINNGFDNLSNAFEIQSQINIESIQYLPKLKVVRDKEKNIREFKKLIKDNKTSISRLDSDETEKKLTLKNENKLLNEKINNEKLNFPNNWVNEYKTFQNLIKSENINRNKYRRSVDSSYEEIEIIHNILNKKDTLYKFEKDFIKFDNVLETNDPKILSKEIKELSKKISRLPENSKITSKLSKVSRNLKKKKVNYKRVRKDFDKSFSIYLSKINSLKTIDGNVENYLGNFLNDTKNTLGLRLQQSLPKDVALYLASCKSSHRNLSLYF
jgi:tripartite ATP-independent transporter DctM subunit